MEMNDATRVMGAAGAPPAMDRTMVAGAPVMPPSGATQMGVTVACPICRTNNSGMESFCGECGFLLTSSPGQEEAAPEETGGPAVELVENTSGRRFKLKPGPNLVGRENCDILLMEATVSRRHAQVTLENGAVAITDLGSTNGTEVNGSRLAPNQPTPLSPGGTVRFGNAVLSFAGAAPGTEPIAAPADVTVQVGAVPNAVSDQTLVGVPGGMPQAAAEPAAAAATSVPEAPAAEPGGTPVAAPVEAAPAAAAPEAVAMLRPTAGAGAPITVRMGTFTIGRRAGNDIVIPDDPYISGAHAMLQSDATGCFLTDVGSTNGTTVNGAKLDPNTRQLLLDGDEVMLGQTTYRYETIAAPPEQTDGGTAELVANPDDLAAAEETGPGPDEVVG